MKKLLIVCGMMLLGTGAFAQLGDFKIGAGLGVGTTGIAIDVSGTYGNYLGARFGVDIMPNIKVKTDIDLKTEGVNKQVSQLTNEINQLNTQLIATGRQPVDLSRYPGGNLPNKLDVEGKWSNTTWHLLFDVYPFGAASSFHVTAGAYFAPKKIVSVYNQTDGFLQPVVAYNNAIAYANNAPAGDPVKNVVNQYGLTMIGAELGDYFITPDPDHHGNVEATIEVGGFRPYLGLGFGRAVPKGRIGVQFDLGVQFWGTPKVYAPAAVKTATGAFVIEPNGNLQVENVQLQKNAVGGDAGGAIKTISKITVYPVLNLRLTGRIL